LTISDHLNPADANDFTRDLLRHISQATPDFVYAKDLNSRMIFANHAVLRTLGKTWEEIRGKSDVEWHSDPDEARALVAADARIMAGQLTESLEEVVTTPEGPQVYLSTKSPLRAADGRVIGLFGVSMNITERKASERLRQLLSEELDHRVRNTLALVQVMARQTLKTASVDEAAWHAFEGRLQAMAKANSLLTRDRWQGERMCAIVAEALEIQGTSQFGRFDIAGPDVWIDAHNALELAMVLHELGTNALKHGALSVPAGRVAIVWAVDWSGASPMLEFDWQESGGPDVRPPTRRGFGSRLIENAFGGRGPNPPHVVFAAAGVSFRARIPIGSRGTPG